MNTAEILNFPIADMGIQEQRVAELEDGYARLSNMLLEEYSGADLTKRHFKVLLAVLRLTYGWSKAMDRISDSQISAIAKLPVKKCNEAKLELVRMNVLVKNGTLLGPNKNVSEWNIPQSGGEPPKMGDKTSPKTGVSHPPKQGDTKDIIPKKEIQKDITPIVPTGDVCEKPPEIIQPEENKSDPVRQVFTHWQTEHNHTTAKLDQKRRKRISARLAEGFTPDELCRAISGAKADSWLMGKNPSHKRYDGIDTLLRDAAQVERLRDLAGDAHAIAVAQGQYSATTARNLDTLQRWAGSTDTGAPF